jgi:hypothetical protein
MKEIITRYEFTIFNSQWMKEIITRYEFTIFNSHFSFSRKGWRFLVFTLDSVVSWRKTVVVCFTKHTRENNRDCCGVLYEAHQRTTEISFSEQAGALVTETWTQAGALVTERPELTAFPQLRGSKEHWGQNSQHRFLPISSSPTIVVGIPWQDQSLNPFWFFESVGLTILRESFATYDTSK